MSHMLRVLSAVLWQYLLRFITQTKTHFKFTWVRSTKYIVCRKVEHNLIFLHIRKISFSSIWSVYIRVYNSVIIAVNGWQGGLSSVNPILNRGGGQIMPTTLILPTRIWKPKRHLCNIGIHIIKLLCVGCWKIVDTSKLGAIL